MPSKESFQTDLALSVDYIFDRMAKLTQTEQLMLNQERLIKDKIHTIIKLMRSSETYNDVPMVAKYCKYEYEAGNILHERHVYMVHKLDIEYGKFRA